MRAAGTAGAANFSATLPAGSWHLFIGQDADADEVVGIPTRRWGTAGTTAAPDELVVQPGQTTITHVPLGFPIENEPNNGIATASFLPVGGYLFGTLTASDLDFYRLRVAEAAEVTIETGGWLEAFCGYAMSVNTRLVLMRDDLTVIATNEDISASNRCSRITAVLEPGTYYVQVTWLAPAFPGLTERIYTIRAW